MSTADGTIRFDTEINNSKMEKGLNSIKKTIEDFAKSGGSAFDKVDKAVESTADTMQQVADGVQNIQSDKLDKLVKQWDNLNAQIEVQKKLLDTLQQKYERVSELKGPDSEEALKMEKNLLKAEAALDKMIEKSDKYAQKAQEIEDSSKQAADGIDKLSSKSTSAASDVEKLSESAQKADGNLDSLKESASGAGDELSGISDGANGATSGLSQVGTILDEIAGKGNGFSNVLSIVSGGLQALPGAAGGASGAISSLASSVGGLSSSGAAMAGVLGGAVITAVTALDAAMDKLFERTEEMREGFATLEVNADSMGVSMDTVNSGMEEFNLISEDFNANTEAMSNLLAAGFEDSNMAEIVERLSDAVIKFPDTLKIESLADSLQETIATKEATGQFAELLERLGVDVDKFNEGLQRASESGKEQQYVLQQLSKTELPGLTDAYKRNNKEMIEFKNSEYELEKSLSDLAKELEPLKYGWDTAWNQIKKVGVDAITSMIKGIKDLIDWIKKLGDEQRNQDMQNNYRQISKTTSPYLLPQTVENAPMFNGIMTYSGGEQVITSPKATRLLSGNSMFNVFGKEGLNSNENIERLIDSLKSVFNNMGITVNNDISINVSIDGLDGFMEILEGLQDYPLSVQKGWAGF